jgi:predicted Zn-dependent protease
MMGAEHFLTGRIAIIKGDYASAVTSFENLYKASMAPDQVLYAAFLGDALTRAGLIDSAIAVMTGALKDNPNSNFCLRILADAYDKAGRKDAQREILARYVAVMKDADDGNPFIDRASAQLEQLNRKNL